MRLDRGRRVEADTAGPLAGAGRRAAPEPAMTSPCCDPHLQRDLRACHRHEPEVDGADLVATLTLEAGRREDGLPPFVVGAPEPRRVETSRCGKGHPDLSGRGVGPVR